MPDVPQTHASTPSATGTAFAPTARRRHVVQGVGAGVAALAIGAGRAQAGQTPPLPAEVSAQPAAAQNTPFFSPAEKAFLTAACERLFPEDASGPGATTLGVPDYIEQQMATPWARGETWYMQAPHVNGPANLGYQLPYTPQQLYRLGITGTQAWVQAQHQTLFENLPPATQDALLSALENNITQFDGLPSGQFFEQLRSDTIEGAFADPQHGGNRHLAGWTMMGFPGARGDYMDWVDRYDTPYPYGPVSISGETP